MPYCHDVAILGAGVAGLTAAYGLRDRDVVVLEAADHIGGRTLSETFDDDSWANYAAVADELGLNLIPSGFHSGEFRLAVTPD